MSQLPVARAHVARHECFRVETALVQTVDRWIDLTELADPLRSNRMRREFLLADPLGEPITVEENHSLDLRNLYMDGELERLSVVHTARTRRRVGRLGSHKTVPLNVPRTQEQVFELGKSDWRRRNTLMCLRDEQKWFFDDSRAFASSS
jgi:hypothetical protein